LELVESAAMSYAAEKATKILNQCEDIFGPLPGARRDWLIEAITGAFDTARSDTSQPTKKEIESSPIIDTTLS
jgi:hypothetical protein